MPRMLGEGNTIGAVGTCSAVLFILWGESLCAWVDGEARCSLSEHEHDLRSGLR